MKIDGAISPDPALAVRNARAAEAAGYHGAWTSETSHDPFVAALLAAEHTERLDVGTAIAVAFARSPMTVAQTANDLQLVSQGRFILGLGSQIKPHIEKRFSMPWSHPAPRMLEFVSAMRAIWSSWHDGTKLDFRGDFYTHTLMTEFVNPGANSYGPPKVFLAGVGQKMTEVAGAVCDGFLVHGFSTPRYFREVTRPALERGRASSTRPDFEVAWPVLVVTGTTEHEVAAAAMATKKQIAFYGSTPAYRPVLEHHGWGDLQDELNALSKDGRWDDMGAAVSDEVLHAFAVVGASEEIASELHRRYSGLADRISFYTPYKVDLGVLDEIGRQLRAS